VLFALDKDKSELPAHADEEQVLGTAMILMVLKLWFCNGT
jgi:hypothetical protein